ncbi:MAG: YceI family protein [Pseudomonadota bacterium]|nr:YceI family protein [Pseudomonadota bacterium]
MGLWFAMCAPAFAAVLGFGPGDGQVAFQLASSLHGVEGQALAFSGQLDTAARTGTFTVEAGGLTTGLGPRDSRMLAWCLEATRFPAITLVVSRIEGALAPFGGGAGSGVLSLIGTLTIRDVTRDVVVPATFAWEGEKLRIKGRHDMKWTDWNLPDPSTVLSTVSPDMAVVFDIVARPS